MFIVLVGFPILCFFHTSFALQLQKCANNYLHHLPSTQYDLIKFSLCHNNTVFVVVVVDLNQTVNI